MKRKLPKLSLVLASLSLVWEPGLAQDAMSKSFTSKGVSETASTQVQREPLQTVFKELENYFKVNIIFEDNSIKGQFTFVEMNDLKQLTIDEALAQIVKPLNLVYKKLMIKTLLSNKKVKKLKCFLSYQLNQK